MYSHYMQEAGLCALRHAIGGVVHFKAMECTAHVDAWGLPPSSQPSSPAVSDANGTLIRTVKNGDTGYDPVIKRDQLEKILGLSWHDDEVCDLEARCCVAMAGVGKIISVGCIATPSIEKLKFTGSLGNVHFFSSCFLQEGQCFNLGKVVYVLRVSAELALSWVKIHA